MEAEGEGKSVAFKESKAPIGPPLQVSTAQRFFSRQKTNPSETSKTSSREVPQYKNGPRICLERK